MNYLGYAHWGLVVILAAIYLLRKWQGANVATKPLFASFLLFCTGIGLALTDGDFHKTSFLDFLLFLNVNYASTVIAIAYSFFIFWVVSAIIFKEQIG